MSKKDVILFLSAYSYLSNPQFFAIAPYLTQFTTIYLDTKDPVSFVFNKERYQNKEKILSIFDRYDKIQEFPFETSKVKSKWEKIKKLKVFREYKTFFRKYLNEIKPSAVISCSDMNVSDQIAS